MFENLRANGTVPVLHRKELLRILAWLGEFVHTMAATAPVGYQYLSINNEAD